MKNKRKGKGNFLCACGKVFIRQYSLVKHLNACEECEKPSSGDKTGELKKCKFCPNTFDNVEEYLAHIEDIHKSKKSYFMCSVCGKQYKTKSELTHHINSKCGTLKQFKCKICHQELMSAGSLYNHMLRHNGERSFMCRFCAKLFFTAGQLKVHERIHTHDKAYICEVCNKGFCHRQSLITHSTLHTGIKPYQCENCGNSFSCVGNLIKHRKTHADTCGLVPLTTHRVKHPSTKIKVKINTPANSRLKTREKDMELQKELETIKTELDKKQTGDCNLTSPHPLTDEGTDVSNDSFNKNADLNNSKTQITEAIEEDPKTEHDIFLTHLEMEPKILEESSNDTDLDIKDANCNSNSESKVQSTTETSRESTDTISPQENKEKRLRKREKNPEYEKQLQQFLEETNFEKHGDCKYCGKRYTNPRWLHRHVTQHEHNIPQGSENTTKAEIPLHRCSCCKKSFYTKEENLAHQQAVHADILTCQDCDKIFANRDSLRSHQKVFHKGVERKTYLYICDKCGKQFKQKSYLKSHEERNCDRGPFFECSLCKKQFSSRHTRNNHMRIHSPEKKLLCKFCAKGFHWKGQLKIHERSHTGEKPFACLYCPKAFAYRESLITHSTMHTGIKPHLCEGCGSRFSCIGNLIKHRVSHATECGSWTYKSQKLERTHAV